jgi:hypothetical protein
VVAAVLCLLVSFAMPWAEVAVGEAAIFVQGSLHYIDDPYENREARRAMTPSSMSPMTRPSGSTVPRMTGPRRQSR